MTTESNGKRRAARRGNNEGNIRQRPDGTWEARVSLPNGGRKSYYGKTRAEVARKLTEARRTLDQGLPVQTGRLTVSQFLERWLEDVVKVTCRYRTYEVFAHTTRRHIIPAMAKVQLTNLTPVQVQTFINRKSREVSPQMGYRCRELLRIALNVAKKWGLVSVNAASATEPPKVSHKDIRVLTADDARAILAAFAGTRMQTFVTTALTLGLRRGELLGLRWQDIDLDRATLTVRHQLQRQGDAWVFVEPKSTAGRRTLPLPAFLVDELRAHRTRQLADRLKAGPLWEGEAYDLVFPTQAGTPQRGENVWAVFQTGLTKAGLPRMPLHGLRHGTATMLLAQGATHRELMAVLGHSNYSTTMNIYAHVNADVLRENAERMQRALVGG